MPLSHNAAAGRTAVSMEWLIKFSERVPPHYTTGDVVTHIVGERARGQRSSRTAASAWAASPIARRRRACATRSA